MVQPFGNQGVGERLHDVLLPHHLSEIAGTVLAGEHDVGHAGDSTVRSLPLPLQLQESELKYACVRKSATARGVTHASARLRKSL